jgi:hypothetical protein
VLPAEFEALRRLLEARLGPILFRY